MPFLFKIDLIWLILKKKTIHHLWFYHKNLKNISGGWKNCYSVKRPISQLSTSIFHWRQNLAKTLYKYKWYTYFDIFYLDLSYLKLLEIKSLCSVPFCYLLIVLKGVQNHFFRKHCFCRNWKESCLKTSLQNFFDKITKGRVFSSKWAMFCEF